MPGLEVLERIQRRLLWLAVRMVDAANRSTSAEIKIGGHQASSASMASIMTALWFCHLSGADKVAVKPHAAPLYHAIKYLCGDLDRSYLTRLRRKGGLQAYPSRTKDPDVADYSTGSVGLGAVAPLFDAAVRRYLDAHFGAGMPGRFIATCGDAELDEGNVWEAVLDPAVERLGNVLLIVDLNRQSLDRVVPDIRAPRIATAFENAGWHVELAKYGRRLEAAFARPGGEHLRRHIDAMSNEEYQSLFAYRGGELRERFLAGADAAVARAVADVGGRGSQSAHPQSRRSRPRDTGRQVSPVRRGGGPAECRPRLHDQGLGSADGRGPAQPRRPLEYQADRRPPNFAGAGYGFRVGPVRAGLAGGGTV